MGASPSPNGVFGPLFALRSFTWMWVMRRPFSLRNGSGDPWLPATQWPMSGWRR